MAGDDATTGRRGPLAGLRVLDLSAGLAGPYCARLLAGYGADVVKLEQRATPDWTRACLPSVPIGTAGEDAGVTYLHVNAGKRGITLDLGSAAGVRLLHDLIDAADVVVECRPESERNRLGLDRESFEGRHPGTVLASVTDFGPEGPYASWLADDLVHMALSGWMAVQGEAGRPPLAAGGDYISYLTGQVAALGVVAAVMAAEAGGRGQVVDVRAFEVAVTSQLYDTVAYSYTGRKRPRRANTAGQPWVVLPTSDGHVAAASSAIRAWDELWSIVFGPGSLPPRAMAPIDDADRDRHLRVLSELIRGREKRELVELCQTLGHLVGEVHTLTEVLESPQLTARAFFDELDYGDRTLRHPGAPARLPGSPWRARRRAPAHGEHTEEVLAEWLGTPRRRAPAGGSERPLHGIRVVDFTMGWAGPFATQLLSDLGAEVVKVESVTRTDWWRTARRIFTGDAPDPDYLWEQSPLFNSVNEGKLGVTLDLAHEEGRAVALRLIRSADLVVENFTPRVMRSLRLSFDDLRVVNPDLVMVSMPGFGLEGPWRDYRSTALITESAAGLTERCGYRGGVPQVIAMSLADSNAGIVAAFGAVLALRHRRATGAGQHVEVAQVEAVIGHLGAELLQTQLAGRSPERRENTVPGAAPSGCYRAAGEDSWVVVSVRTDEQWRALARVLGLAVTPSWSTVPGRLADRSRIDAEVEEWTRRRPAKEAAGILQANGVPAAPVADAAEVLADPHLASTGFFHALDRPHVGTHRYPSAPMRLSGTPLRRRSPAPTLGRHNDHVLRDLLGMEESEIVRLRKLGLIGEEPLGTKDGRVVVQ
ncbi:CoA transferase [Thermocatellispora tengchongensis]